MEEDHTSVLLGACLCHQLRAHELRAEEHILWIVLVLQATSPQEYTRLSDDSLLLILTLSSTLRDIVDHRNHETCLS